MLTFTYVFQAEGVWHFVRKFPHSIFITRFNEVHNSTQSAKSNGNIGIDFWELFYVKENIANNFKFNSMVFLFNKSETNIK